MQQRRFRLHYYAVALFLSATAVVSCDKNTGETLVVDDENKFPSIEVLNLDVAYTEYGKTKMLLEAPLLQRFLFSEEPYSVFPNGFQVQFYSDSAMLETQITANYAIYKERPVELWMATGNVVVMNFEKKQALYTDTLYWNRVEHSIYTDAPVRVETEDGVMKGRNGMTSDEKFTTYVFKNVGDSHYYFDDTPRPPADTTVSVIL